MAPAGGRKSEPVYLHDRFESEEDDTAEAMNKANNLIANVCIVKIIAAFIISSHANASSQARKRKEAKRMSIQNAHRQRVEDLRTRMSTLFETRKSKVYVFQGRSSEM